MQDKTAANLAAVLRVRVYTVITKEALVRQHHSLPLHGLRGGGGGPAQPGRRGWAMKCWLGVRVGESVTVLEFAVM